MQRLPEAIRELRDTARLDPHNTFVFQAEDGIRDVAVTGVQTCALPISHRIARRRSISPDVVEIRLRRRGTVGGATKRILPVAPLAEHLVVEPVPLGGSGARHEVAGRGCKDPWRVSETVARGAGQTGGVEGLECRLRGGGYYTD